MPVVFAPMRSQFSGAEIDRSIRAIQQPRIRVEFIDRNGNIRRRQLEHGRELAVSAGRDCETHNAIAPHEFFCIHPDRIGNRHRESHHVPAIVDEPSCPVPNEPLAPREDKPNAVPVCLQKPPRVRAFRLSLGAGKVGPLVNVVWRFDVAFRSICCAGSLRLLEVWRGFRHGQQLLKRVTVAEVVTQILPVSF